MPTIKYTEQHTSAALARPPAVIKNKLFRMGCPCESSDGERSGVLGGCSRDGSAWLTVTFAQCSISIVSPFMAGSCTPPPVLPSIIARLRS